ncbi:SGNH hydrolase-type protein [Rhizobium phage RHph_TM16]|nr:SGNH hydrolase-type protein [Rhizobium phage RHph_TM16]
MSQRVLGDVPGNVITMGGTSFVGHPLLGGQPKWVRRLAHTLYGAGYNSGAAPLTGDGTAKTMAVNNYVNLSGAPINVASVVFQGWTLRTTGTTDASASYTVTGGIEYPVGTQIGTYSVTVNPGQNNFSTDVTLSTPIPAGATFRVTGSATPANAATYIANLGFAGLRTYQKSTLLKKLALAAFGDSIFTNNNGAIINAASSRCPAYLASITGTTAATYGASSAANFAKQADLANVLGCTHVVTNFGTNDFGASTVLATLQGYLTSMRDMVRGLGMKFVQATMLVRTKSTSTAVTMTSVGASSNIITATVPDASKFKVGAAYIIAGATETEYNGTKVCVARNTGSNTVSFQFTQGANAVATGTITVTPWKVTMDIGFQEVYSSFYAAGGSSPRGLFNAWVRGGAFDDYIETADPFEPSRDAGRWKVGGEDASLPDYQLATVTSLVSTSRFVSNYSRGNATIPNGVVQPASGANVGQLKGGSNNTGGDITAVSAFTSAFTVGDTVHCVPGVSYCSDDGTHPRVAGGAFGAQPLLDNAIAAWIDARV